MAKQLVQRSNVAEYVCPDTGTLFVDATILLTPGAKDYLSEKGIPIVYGSPPKERPQNNQGSATTGPSEQVLCEQVAQILRGTYGIADEAQIEAISKQVLKRLKSGDAPAGKDRNRDSS